MHRLGTRATALLAALVLATLGLLLDPSRAFACECTSISTSRALRQADTVFHGTVLSTDDVRRGKGDRTDIRFQVDGVYKGTAYREQVVASPSEAAACGLVPEIGSTWVIFAVDGIEGSGDDTVARLVTTSCSGNLADASAPPILGRARSPLDGRSDREERSTNADRAITRWFVGAGIAGLSMVAVAGVGLALLWRPGRRTR